MSKTSQRKQQAFDEGYKDGLQGEVYRWKKHPFLGAYNGGYNKGKFDRESKKLADYPNLSKSLFTAKNPETGMPEFKPAEIVKIINNLPDECDDRRCLGECFIWSETRQGHDYWQSVDERIGEAYKDADG